VTLWERLEGFALPSIFFGDVDLTNAPLVVFGPVETEVRIVFPAPERQTDPGSSTARPTA
jgi:hypothetical protein